MNKERLLAVAKALRESRNPKRFTMTKYAHGCGTPACAFGHYASRDDLQDVMKICDVDKIPVWIESDQPADFDDDRSLAHFELDEDEASELFCGVGCNFATTPIEAAEFIERFVAEHEAGE